MALPTHALVTLAELKSFMPTQGTGKDAQLERAIDCASRDIEEDGVGGRRLRWRAPTEDPDAIYSGTWSTGTPAPSGQPSSAGRFAVITFPATATTGTVTITGTVGGVAGVTEAFDAVNGLLQYGLKPFTAVAALAIAGGSGTGTVKVGTSLGYVELYSPGGCEITPIEWPIRYVAEVNEDLARVFAAATALAATQYEIREPSSIGRRIARVSGHLDFPFLSGYRAVKARLSAGYQTTAEVPSKIKGVCLELAAWYFQYSEGKEYGMASRTDALGTVTRTGPPMLTMGMKDRLSAYLRAEFESTAQRDFDLEAA
jgi:hypothetical protein